jgi:hypothetical protein
MDDIIQKTKARLDEVRRIQADFFSKSKQYPYWEGILDQCGKEEQFLIDLLKLLENTP